MVELRPNRIAAGIPFGLLQLEGDLRFVILFLLALIPIAIALRQDIGARGWLLAGVGNAVVFLTLYMPAVAADLLLANADEILGETVRISNPRLSASGAVALGLFGGYMMIFAGLRDLQRIGASQASRIFAAWIGALLLLFALFAGRFEVYSFMVEFRNRGGQLGDRLIEHIMFVGVSLIIGFVVGVGLGLWAFRDKRISPVILYAVGIIQTIPSLALFGLLLEPLARLGDQRVWQAAIPLPTGVLPFLLLTMFIAAALLYLYRRFAAQLSGYARQSLLIMSALAVALPLALSVIILASFMFRASFTVFSSSDSTFANYRVLLAAVLFSALALWLSSRYLRSGRLQYVCRYAGYGGFVVFALVLLAAIVQGSQSFLGRVDGFSALTVRDLGVSGIGTAPAVIALTLYSLLPLVRNTYAGLNNVDLAITDSGRGMGMTASQRFFQIELPIAIPVIMAGVRNAGVALIGIGAVASVIGAGGLGDFILGGIVNTSIDQILLGAIPAVMLAVLLDAALRGVEGLLTSPGIKHLD